MEEALIKSAQTLALNYKLKLNISDDKKDISVVRGEIDYAALEDRYHSKQLHEHLCKTNISFVNILNKCEWARIQAIGCNLYLGVKTNLNKALDVYYLNNDSPLSLGNRLEMEDLVSIYLRANLTCQLLPSHVENLLSKMPIHFIETINLYIPNLRKFLYFQYEYGLEILCLIKELKFEAYSIGKSAISEETINPTNDNSNNESLIKSIESSSSIVNIAKFQPLYQNVLLAKNIHKGYKAMNSSYKESNTIYKIFSKKFDEVVKAKKLIKFNEHEALRQNFLKKSQLYQKQARVEAQNLIKLLQAKQRIKYQYSQETGRLDSNKLVNILKNSSKEIFKLAEYTPTYDTAISILIDNSGSMRGKHIILAAVCAEILLGISEKFKIKCEILGFTTRDWRGGEVYKKWQQEGSPAHPGRLNDLRHIIYKSFNDSIISAKAAIPVIVKENLLKENIDGEALEWASFRLMRQNENKKILIIISDGAPVDDITLKYNNKNLLELHLKNIVRYIEKKTPIKLVAIGIGHDVSKFYNNSITINDAEYLAKEFFNKLIEIFSDKKFSSFP